MKLVLLVSLIVLGSAMAFADGEDDGCSSSEGPKPGHCGNARAICHGAVSQRWGYKPDPNIGWGPGEYEKYMACQRAIYGDQVDRH